MALLIKSIGDKGELASERIGFVAQQAGDLKYNLVFRTHFTSNGFYNRSKDSYWFAPKEVQAGDKVVLYTKGGSDSVQANDDGTHTYFFYWGLNEPIFTDEKQGVVLIGANNWKISRNL